MNIKDYFNILWRRKWIVVITTFVTLLMAVWLTSRMTPVYRASTTLRVAAASGGSLNYTASTYSNQLLNTTAEIANSRPIQEEAMKDLNLHETPIINAEVIPYTELIRITVEYSDPKMAAKIANALADILVVQSNELYTGGSVSSQELLADQIAQYHADLDRTRKEYETLLALTPPAPEKTEITLELLQLKQRNYEALLLQYDDAILQQEIRANMMTIVEPAVAPKSPSEPKVVYNYFLGVVIGLIGGVVLAFMAESFDSTLYSTKDVELAAALPTLARIPRVPKKSVNMAADDKSSLADAFRNLALNILLTDGNKQKKVILVLGAEPKQGKSTVIYNLATALAEFGKTVVAVDCDMRLPSLHTLFNAPNQNGLSDALLRQDNLENLLASSTQGVSVLVSGQQPSNPTQLLGSPQMVKVVEGLCQKFDYVLLDTPALLAVSDTAAILQNVNLVKSLDTILMVVRQSHARRDSVQAASAFIKKFSQLRIGVVLNHADNIVSHYYYAPHRQGMKQT